GKQGSQKPKGSTRPSPGEARAASANPCVPKATKGANPVFAVTTSVPEVILTGSADAWAPPRNVTVAQTTNAVRRDIESLPEQPKARSGAIIAPRRLKLGWGILPGLEGYAG